jgi:hypothetical protein
MMCGAICLLALCESAAGASKQPKSTAKDVQRTVQSAEVFPGRRLAGPSADSTIYGTSPPRRPMGANLK